jgi:glycosyltransferase involved in cell wall biosynthesis
MKILYVTPVFQHPQVRGSTRCYFFGKELAKRHQVTMISIQRSPIPSDVLKEVSSYLDLRLFNAQPNFKKRGALRKVEILVNDYVAIREMRKQFVELIREQAFDVVLFHGKSVFPIIKKFDALPLVIDFCDATSMRINDRIRIAKPWEKLLLKKRLEKFQKIEQSMIRKTPYVAFISCRDRDAVMKQRKGVRIVPNGVDLQYWQRRSKQPRPHCIAFTGVMDYRPNNDAAHYLIDHILPILQKEIPDIEILIIGRDPLKKLVEKAAAHPAVTVTGFVDDVRDYLEQASVFVAPIPYASGVQNKVLEAFAMEMPVVCSEAVAAGLHFEDGEKPPLVVADHPQAFADAIIKLFRDKDYRYKLAKSGRNFVERRFQWDVNVKILEEMMQLAIEEFQNKL